MYNDNDDPEDVNEWNIDNDTKNDNDSLTLNAMMMLNMLMTVRFRSSFSLVMSRLQ